MLSLSGKETYDSIGEFRQGVAIVVKDGKYGAILMGGREIIAPIYRSISLVKNVFIVKKESHNETCGMIDLNGNVLLECNYYSIQPAANNLFL